MHSIQYDYHISMTQRAQVEDKDEIPQMMYAQ